MELIRLQNLKKSTFYFLVFTILISFLFSYSGLLATIENSIQDSLYQSSKGLDTRLVIIGIDDKSLDELGRWPFDRAIHGDLLRILNKSNPASIGFDIIFSEESSGDLSLIENLVGRDNIVFPLYADFDKYTSNESLIIKKINYPLKGIRQNSILGHINFIPDPVDGILRNTLLYLDYKGERINSFSYELYSLYMDQNNLTPTPLDKIPKDAYKQTYIDFVGPPSSIERVSYYDVLTGLIPPEYFTNKIVLIGPTAIGLADDYYYTSIASESQMYGIEVHANIIQNLLRDNYKKRANYLNYIIIGMFSILSYFIFNKLSVQRSFLSLIGFVFLLLSLAKLLYINGLIIEVIYPLLGLFMVFLASIVFKYLKEYMERSRINNLFGKYIHPQVAKEILENQEEINFKGIHKKVSVLFVDIRGFTFLSEEVEAETLISILNKYLNMAVEVVFKYNGTLDKFIGDSVMAFYNAPLDILEPELNAIKTGLEIQERLGALNLDLSKTFNKTIKLGVGISSGYAIIGNIGSELRLEYTAIGDVVNTGSRIEAMAKPGQVLIDETTYQVVKEKIVVIPLGEVGLKGKQTSVKVYEVREVKKND